MSLTLDGSMITPIPPESLKRYLAGLEDAPPIALDLVFGQPTVALPFAEPPQTRIYARIVGHGHTRAVYTDGGCIGASRSTVGASWAWVGVSEEGEEIEHELGIWTPGELGLESVTSNMTEFYAMLQALKRRPDGWSGRVYADSMITIGRWSKSWSLKGIPEAWHKEMGHTLRRLGPLTFIQLDGHPTRPQLAAQELLGEGVPGPGKRGNAVSKFNARADLLCNEALGWLRVLRGDS